MPTEQFRWMDAQQRARGGASAETPVAICFGAIKTLLEAGWTISKRHRSTFSLVLPDGLPWTTPPDPPIPDAEKSTVTGGPHILTAEGMRFVFYDPHRAKPDTSVFDIEWVPMGDSLDASMDNLAAALSPSPYYWQKNTEISATGRWQQLDGSFFHGYWHMDFVSTLPLPDFGPLTDSTVLDNGARWGGLRSLEGAAGTSWFFGFIWPVGALTSLQGSGPTGARVEIVSGSIAVEQYGGGSHSFNLVCTIGVPVRGSGDHHPATFEVAGFKNGELIGERKPVLTLEARSDYPAVGESYTIIANPYQFFAFQPDRAGGTFDHRELFVSMFSGTSVDYSLGFKAYHYYQFAAVISGGGWRYKLNWNQGTAAIGNWEGFSRTLGAGDRLGMFPGLYPVKFDDTLLDSDEQILIGTAYCGIPVAEDLPRTPEGQARIAGILWDAIVLQGDYPLDAAILWDGHYWQCVATHRVYSGAKASLWIAYAKAQTPQ